MSYLKSSVLSSKLLSHNHSILYKERKKEGVEGEYIFQLVARGFDMWGGGHKEERMFLCILESHNHKIIGRS